VNSFSIKGEKPGWIAHDSGLNPIFLPCTFRYTHARGGFGIEF